MCFQVDLRKKFYVNQVATKARGDSYNLQCVTSYKFGVQDETSGVFVYYTEDGTNTMVWVLICSSKGVPMSSIQISFRSMLKFQIWFASNIQISNHFRQKMCIETGVFQTPKLPLFRALFYTNTITSLVIMIAIIDKHWWNFKSIIFRSLTEIQTGTTQLQMIWTHL